MFDDNFFSRAGQVIMMPELLVGHYTMPEWALFVRNRLAPQRAKTMAEHLSDCELCQKLCDQLPPPPRRSLGRPIPNVLFKWPPELEKDIQHVLATLPENGGVVRFSGQWQAEGLVNYLVSLVTARLYRKMKQYGAEGILLLTTSVPPVPNADVAILLNAPSYEDLGVWNELKEGQLIFQIGELTAWREKGIEPDFIFDIDPYIKPKLKPYLDFVKSGIHTGSPAIRAGLLANGLLCDWYRPLLDNDYEDRPERIPFVTVEDLESRPSDYVCAEGGSWLVQHCLRSESMVTLNALKKDLDWFSDRLQDADLRKRLDQEWSQLTARMQAKAGLQIARPDQP